MWLCVGRPGLSEDPAYGMISQQLSTTLHNQSTRWMTTGYPHSVVFWFSSSLAFFYYHWIWPFEGRKWTKLSRVGARSKTFPIGNALVCGYMALAVQDQTRQNFCLNVVNQLIYSWNRTSRADHKPNGPDPLTCLGDGYSSPTGYAWPQGNSPT